MLDTFVSPLNLDIPASGHLPVPLASLSFVFPSAEVASGCLLAIGSILSIARLLNIDAGIESPESDKCGGIPEAS